MRKPAAVMVVLLLVVARPAWAQSTLDKQSVAASSDVALTVAASVDEVDAYNDKVTVEVPDGFRVLACERVEGFACTQTTATAPRRTLVTWQRTAPGQPIPFATDHFPFRMHTVDKAGKYTFAVTQSYSNDKTERSAPVLQVTPAAAPRTTTITAALTRVAVRAATAQAHPTFPPARRGPAHVPVTEPAWFGDNSGEAGPQLAIHEAGANERRSPTRMVFAGVGMAFAASGVFWLRRRVRSI